MNFGFQPKNDLNDNCMHASFSSQEIMDELKSVLNKNFTKNHATITKVMDLVSGSLVKIAWEDRFRRINDKIQKFVRYLNDPVNPQSRTNAEQMANSITETVGSVITFIQIHGGLIPELAKAEKVPIDFLNAFNLTIELLKNIHWKPISTDKMFSSLRDKTNELIYNTLAQLMNYNLVNFQQADQLTDCFSQIIEYVDVNGMFANKLIPPLRRFFRKFQTQTFKENLKTKTLKAAIELMIISDADFTEQIKELPNDFQKFAALDKRANDRPFFKEEAINCALHTDSIEVICYAAKKYPSNEMYERVLFKLGEIASKWITFVISGALAPSREYFRYYSSLIDILTPMDKDHVYEAIGSSELGKSLQAQKFFKLTEDKDNMIKEIRTILQYVH